MPMVLGRSKSLRVLRGSHKELHQQEAGHITPPPTLSAVEVDQLKAATPVTQTVGNMETSDPEMLQRPSTSAGQGDRSTLFHRKVTPSQNPEGPHVSYVSPTKSTTLLYTAEVLSEQEGIIGIALGSPSMAPQHWNAPRSTDFVTQNQAHGNVTKISSNNQIPQSFFDFSEGQEEAPKQKVSRWKSIFKKTAPPSRPNKDSFYQLAKQVNAARVDSHEDVGTPDINSPAPAPAPAQEEAASKEPSPTYTYKSDIRPSRRGNKGQTQPVADTRSRALTVGSTSTPKAKSPLARFAFNPRPQIPRQNSTVPAVTVSAAPQTMSSRHPNDKPLLDVAIPTVRMERYSVMFSGLLQPGAQGANASSSLLQRRQGNTDKVTPLNGLQVKNGQPGDGLQRRATSPAKSPSGHLSLWPSASTSKTPSPRPVTMHRPRPLKRSQTAPGTSPSQSKFPTQSTQRTEQEDDDDSDTPSLSRTSSPDSSNRSFDFTSEEITIVVDPSNARQPPRVAVQADEPVWEIIQRQSSANTVTKTSALRSHPTESFLASPSPREPTPTSASRSPGLARTQSHTALSPRLGTERFGTGRTASETTVGVARSVSLSRATRSPDRLLSPGSIMSPVERLTPGRFVDSKPLTPTLVELKNRRSQRVQLVDA